MPRVGENIELQEGKFRVVEVSHRFSGSSLKHVVVVTVEKPQPTVVDLHSLEDNRPCASLSDEEPAGDLGEWLYLLFLTRCELNAPVGECT